ncbi:MAG: N-acyl-D-amino-acid deacylase family protein [Henriciella sp.]
MSEFDLVIRGGLIVDGSGEAPFHADIGLRDGVIAQIGMDLGAGQEEMAAHGLIVTPGFVDIHTHYDGQATWDSRLTPSSEHGVTTVVMGNCGVGFAPCRPQDRGRLISLMEGVEDIPNPVLSAGLSWSWESFEDYLEALDSRAHDIDFACQIPHGPLRVHVMGERGAAREPASEADIAAMAALAGEAIRAGALGFSTSRTLNHRTSDGDPTPSYMAAERELVGIAKGLQAAGGGLLQVVSDFTDGPLERQLLRTMVAESGRPMIVTVAQSHRAPDGWRELLDWIEAENRNGLDIKGLVCGRPVGVLLGLDATMNPFSLNSAYQALADLPLAERVAAMRRTDMRARILAAADDAPDNAFNALIANYDYMFILGDPPDYEQRPDQSLAARARREGTTPQALAYDALLEQDGAALLYTPFLNYAGFSLDPSLDMMRHPHTVLGLGDGGAHVGMICDGSFPTSMLTHWTRDRTRGPQLGLAEAVRAQTWDTARAYGLQDRGLLRPGFKADLNLIDHTRLRLHPPKMVHDLPAGGKRLMQEAEGYVATLVSGIVIQRDGQPTGALPGRLVRGQQAARVDLAAE